MISYSSLFPEPVVLRLLHPPRLLLLLLPPPPLLLLLPPLPLLLLPPPPLLLPLNEGGSPELLLAESQLLELLLGLGPRVLDFFKKNFFTFLLFLTLLGTAISPGPQTCPARCPAPSYPLARGASQPPCGSSGTLAPSSPSARTCLAGWKGWCGTCGRAWGSEGPWVAADAADAAVAAASRPSSGLWPPQKRLESRKGPVLGFFVV